LPDSGSDGVGFCQILSPGYPNLTVGFWDEEIIYVLDGSLDYQVEGQPTRTSHAGDALTVPAGAVHAVRNVGSGTGSVLATDVVEKGKPLLTLAE
jgi:quercetin dioxygenase-like cupin family protein